MLRNCTAARYAINKARMVRLAEYSRDCLQRPARRHRHRLRRAHAGHAAAVPHAEAARRQRRATSPCCAQTASPSSCSTATAASATSRRSAQVSDKFVGGLLLPGDETGDCFKFTQALAKLAAEPRRRVPLRHDDPAASMRSGKRLDGVVTDAGTLDGRRLPGRARQLLAAAARRRSASASRSIRSRATRSPCRSPTPTGAPESTVMDETHKVAVTRLGDRIRVGGTAELAGYT